MEFKQSVLDQLQEEILQECDKRLHFLIKSRNNPQLQALEMDMCTNDILHWFKNHVYTDKNTNLYPSNEIPHVIPFIPYPFQEELITELWSSIQNWAMSPSERTDLTNVFIEKSRQMGASWCVMGVFAYGYNFHNHKYHCISQKEEDVDKSGNIRSLMEKARFILNNMPKWMRAKGYTPKIGSEHNKHLVISRADGTGAITWESANPNASRSGTYNAVFKDEMAFMANAQQINTAAASATPCRIMTSTPNGEGNEFYRMRKFTQWRKDENWEDLAPEIKGLRYHWSDHPLYDEEWYKWKTNGMTPEKIAQELEIDYNTALEWRVYKDFPKHSEVVVYDPSQQTYVWMDNGGSTSDPFAIVVAQWDNNHYINIIDAIEVNYDAKQVASYLSCHPVGVQMTNSELEFLERFKCYNPKKAIFISDPYDSMQTKIDSSVYREFMKVGIYLELPSERRKGEQIMITSSNLYRLRYNDQCLDYASAMMNAKYPKLSETNNRTTANNKPVHDWTSHFRTATEYWVVRMIANPQVNAKRVVDDERPTRDATGKLIYKDERRARRTATGKLIYS